MCLPREQTGANYKQLNVVSGRGLCHTVSLGLGLGLWVLMTAVLEKRIWERRNDEVMHSLNSFNVRSLSLGFQKSPKSQTCD